MATPPGLRKREPRALIFLEPEVLAAGPDEDPLELYATALGLAPITGRVEAIDPPVTTAFTIERTGEGLQMCAAHGAETVPAAGLDLCKWLEATDGHAVVLVGRGLGLSRPVPTIEEALVLRPAWGGAPR
jgi:hypothetical protein